MPDDKVKLQPASKIEGVMELLAVGASAVPKWFAGPIAEIAGGVATSLKIQRVTKFVEEVLSRIETVHSEMSEEFVKTEDFIDIFDKTAQNVANERREEKRKLFSIYLLRNIASPTISYDERLKVLRTIEQIDSRHIDLLKALLAKPSKDETEASIGSPIGTLNRRVPHLQKDLDAVLHETNTFGLTNIEKRSLHMTTTGSGAAELSSAVTPLGNKLMGFLE